MIFSLRSSRQRKAWGGAQRNPRKRRLDTKARGAGDSRELVAGYRPLRSLSGKSHDWICMDGCALCDQILGRGTSVEAAKQSERLLASRAAKRSVGNGESNEWSLRSWRQSCFTETRCRQLRRLVGFKYSTPHASLRYAWGYHSVRLLSSLVRGDNSGDPTRSEADRGEPQ
jgi:hypothetical protein